MKGGFNWENSYITAYNFETNSYETTLITTKSEDPSENVTDIFRNIKIACMIIQDSLVRYNYDIPKVFKYSKEKGPRVFARIRSNQITRIRII